MRAFIRVVAVVTLSLVALVANAGDIIDPWHPYGALGLTSDSAGVVVTVGPAAARQGVRVGDRIALHKLAAGERMYTSALSPVAPGTVVNVPFASGKTVRIVAAATSRSPADNISDIFSVLVLVMYTMLAGALVLLRPTPATWAFFAFSQYFLYNGSQDMQYMPAVPYIFMVFLVPAFLQAISPAAFFSFALRFPNAVPRGSAARAERLMLFVVAPVLAVWNCINSGALVVAGVAIPQWQTNLCLYLITALYLPGIAVLFARYSTSSSEERVRIRWVAAAFAVAFLPLCIFNVTSVAISSVPSVWIGNCTQAWLIIAPAALAYTILKHRLFDIRFVVSRALVYGILTTLTVGILALADWGLGRWLAQSRFELVAEVAVALLIGFSLTTLHSRIERFLNGVIFRAQTLALATVRRFTHEIDLINDPGQLLAQTSETLRQRIECDYVAIFTAEGNAFVLSSAEPVPLPGLLSANDLAVLRLRRWHEPFECDVPDHALRGALLLPMAVRTQLVGFIACGPKTDHTHYLPDEVAALESLAHRCGAAYAWLTLRPVTAEALVAE